MQPRKNSILPVFFSVIQHLAKQDAGLTNFLAFTCSLVTESYVDKSLKTQVGSVMVKYVTVKHLSANQIG
jgi:hypothetical protein